MNICASKLRKSASSFPEKESAHFCKNSCTVLSFCLTASVIAEKRQIRHLSILTDILNLSAGQGKGFQKIENPVAVFVLVNGLVCRNLPKNGGFPAAAAPKR